MNDLSQARKLIKDSLNTQNPYLDLGRCGITDLKELPELFDCTHLEALILSNEWYDENGYESESNNKGKYNKISSIPEEISNLKRLTALNLGGTYDNRLEITDIRFLENQTGLQTLNLSNNQITDIRFLEKLTGLQILDLKNNKIKEVPKFIFHLNMEIDMREYGGEGLFLFGNPIETPPVEILKQGKEAVLTYFRQIEKQGRAYIYEAKLILVGQGSAGKTSLQKRLLNKNAPLPDEKDRIMNALKDIIKDYREVEEEIYVRCPCKKCQSSEKPTRFRYDGLKELSNVEQRDFVTCNKSDTRLRISDLLRDVGFGEKGTPPSLRIIPIFLASSEELKEDRKEFENFINRENKEYIKKGIFFRLEVWEDFIDRISETRLQDEYNKVVINSDIFISLFWTKAGKYTKEEFSEAYHHFKKTGKPSIYTYFKTAPVNPMAHNTESIHKFRAELQELGHFSRHLIKHKRLEVSV